MPAGHALIAPAAAPPVSSQTQSLPHLGTWPLCRMPTPSRLTPHTSSLFPPRGPPWLGAMQPGAHEPTHVITHPSCSHTQLLDPAASGARPRALSTSSSACQVRRACSREVLPLTVNRWGRALCSSTRGRHARSRRAGPSAGRLRLRIGGAQPARGAQSSRPSTWSSTAASVRMEQPASGARRDAGGRRRRTCPT